MKIIQAFIKFFKKLIENYKTKRLIKKLQPIANNKQKERTQLRFKVANYIRKFAKMDKDNQSLYIPLDWKTKQLIKYNVEKEFGQEMSKLNVKLNNKLQVV